MNRPRRNHSSTFKVKVAFAVVKGDQTFPRLAERFDVHPHQITQWKIQLLECAGDVLSTAAERRSPDGLSVKDLPAKIGQRALASDFLLPGMSA